jgi:hypothetical protein
MWISFYVFFWSFAWFLLSLLQKLFTMFCSKPMLEVQVGFVKYDGSAELSTYTLSLFPSLHLFTGIVKRSFYECIH